MARRRVYGQGVSIARAAWTWVAAGILAGSILMIRMAWGEEAAGEAILERFETMVRFNLDNPHVLPSSQIDSLMATLEGKTVGQRVAFWADFFYRDGRPRYLFGLDPGGYVSEGRLCDDFQTDCVLFVYRTTELGRSSSAREAVQFAFGTRFYGAGVEEAILPDGKVRYDHPSHLDYSEDMLRSGIWGKDVTGTIGPVQPDPGNSRFPAGSLSFVPKEKVNYAALQPGDIVYLIRDEARSRKVECGSPDALIQHLGILTKEGDEVYLIHAAKSPLAGFYEGGKIEKVLLKTYLSRVDSFKGILISRIEEF